MKFSDSGDGSERLLLAIRRAQPFATPVRILLDVIAWATATAMAVFLRFDASFGPDGFGGVLSVIPLAAAIQILAGFATGLYRRRWQYGSYDEVAALIVVSVITTGALFALNEGYFDSRSIPQSAVLLGGLIGILLMAGIRYLWRLTLERLRRPSTLTAERLLVFGAGEGGLQVITSLLRSRSSPFVPVGLLDDDPSKQRLSLRGVSVLGDRHAMRKAKQSTEATTLLIAVPSASARVIGELADLASECGLTVKVLPPVTELFGQSPGAADIRDLSEADLLGRHQIQTNVEEIAGYLTNRRVLVTGAGGSIGSELCRQIYRFGPAELMMLDRDESALHQVQLSIHGRALLDSGDTILVDIRDSEALTKIFLDRRPQVVFHAAALKHLPLLERFPDEAYKSNVMGTLNVLAAAEACGTDVFVNISTDKAANPISVLGASKRTAERLTAHFAHEARSGTYLSVRFGNVLGSRGSVLTAFEDQIRRGGPVTVTHRDVTRFFMTIPEAVQLVIQAGAIGRSGEVLVLDMGEPVRIHDVARRLVAQSTKPIEIVFTGLRPGEKLHEELLGDGEIDVRPRHPLISHTPVPALDPGELVAEPADSKEWMESRSR